MGKKEKLLERFLAKPKDFTWSELTKLLRGFDYEQLAVGKTGGSRVRFIKDGAPPILLHRPHPKPILKRYQIDAIIMHLKREKVI